MGFLHKEGWTFLKSINFVLIFYKHPWNGLLNKAKNGMHEEAQEMESMGGDESIPSLMFNYLKQTPKGLSRCSCS